MKTSDRIALGLRQLGDSITTLAAVVLRSRPVALRDKQKPQRSLLIMGNGPSLNDVLQAHREALAKYDLMAVNFAANAEVFNELAPQHYVLADPHFFTGAADPNVAKLWTRLNDITWPMTLHLPAKMCRRETVAKWCVHHPERIVQPFNMVAAEGFPWVQRLLIDKGLGMPRPRNVLIPSIMAGIRMGYGNIIIVGADHTWTRTLSVDDENHVVSLQPHFYNDNKAEHERVASVYKDVRLHQVLESMVIAFRSYHQIADYARRRGIQIVNATKGSFIDAFPRQAHI